MEKKSFKLAKDKKVTIIYLEPFLARSKMHSFYIVVDKYFYEEFNSEERKVIIWHELYHRKFLTGLKWVWRSLMRIFIQKNANWEEEFDADLYAAKNYSKKSVLSELQKCKDLCERGILKCESKTHPPIDERIKRINELEREE